jgi:hypothetical protein
VGSCFVLRLLVFQQSFDLIGIKFLK